ncbi:MAG: hypothetical protein J5875_04505 [Paludibacteraceae bacterium]|nr:hypothetical protein [Paludibacteraceae bacterium]
MLKLIGVTLLTYAVFYVGDELYFSDFRFFRHYLVYIAYDISLVLPLACFIRPMNASMISKLVEMFICYLLFVGLAFNYGLKSYTPIVSVAFILIYSFFFVSLCSIKATGKDKSEEGHASGFAGSEEREERFSIKRKCAYRVAGLIAYIYKGQKLLTTDDFEKLTSMLESDYAVLVKEFRRRNVRGGLFKNQKEPFNSVACIDLKGKDEETALLIVDALYSGVSAADLGKASFERFLQVIGYLHANDELVAHVKYLYGLRKSRITRGKGLGLLGVNSTSVVPCCNDVALK